MKCILLQYIITKCDCHRNLENINIIKYQILYSSKVTFRSNRDYQAICVRLILQKSFSLSAKEFFSIGICDNSHVGYSLRLLVSRPNISLNFLREPVNIFQFTFFCPCCRFHNLLVTLM